MSIGGLKEISRILPLEPPCLVWYTGFSVGAWRSPGAHLHGVQGVAGSNPAAPTISAAIGDANGSDTIKVREAIRIIEADGWYFIHFRGSHRQFKHPAKRGRVTIPGKPGDDLDAWLWSQIRRQAQL